MNWVEISWLLIGFLIGVTVLRGLSPMAYRFGLKVRFWIRHGRKGKFILFVYSDSSNWKEYVEAKLLPRIEVHAVVLNWSKRREWETRMRFEKKLFDQWAGSGEFTPTAIVLPVFGKVRVFRLWPSPQHLKQRKESVSKEAEQALLKTLKELGPQREPSS